jgi:Flp pilus assembly protein TadG
MAAMRRRRRGVSDRGAEIVEFAIAMPIMLLLMAGVIDFALLFQSYEVATNAAREGARLAVLPGYEVNNYQAARSRVASYLTAGGARGTAVTTVTPVGLNAGGALTLNGVQVRVDYTHQFLFVGPVVGLINGTFGRNLTFRAETRMRSEVQP